MLHTLLTIKVKAVERNQSDKHDIGHTVVIEYVLCVTFDQIKSLLQNFEGDKFCEFCCTVSAKVFSGNIWRCGGQ